MAPRARQHYSDAQRAEALAVLDACDGCVSEAARKTGIPRKSLALWASARDRAAPAELRQEKSGDLDARLTSLISRYLDAIEQLIASGTLRDVQGGLKIAVEAQMALRQTMQGDGHGGPALAIYVYGGGKVVRDG